MLRSPRQPESFLWKCATKYKACSIVALVSLTGIFLKLRNYRTYYFVNFVYTGYPIFCLHNTGYTPRPWDCFIGVRQPASTHFFVGQFWREVCTVRAAPTRKHPNLRQRFQILVVTPSFWTTLWAQPIIIYPVGFSCSARRLSIVSFNQDFLRSILHKK